MIFRPRSLFAASRKLGLLESATYTLADRQMTPAAAVALFFAVSQQPAGLAQSAERETLNLKVGGSTPPFGFFFAPFSIKLVVKNFWRLGMWIYQSEPFRGSYLALSPQYETST
ncbi:hypothetical protein BDW62DRAFT_176320 [Aspergillus aurantiobrunneus]